jgi:hypothetical protein
LDDTNGTLVIHYHSPYYKNPLWDEWQQTLRDSSRILADDSDLDYEPDLEEDDG